MSGLFRLFPSVLLLSFFVADTALCQNQASCPVLATLATSKRPWPDGRVLRMTGPALQKVDSETGADHLRVIAEEVSRVAELCIGQGNPTRFRGVRMGLGGYYEGCF